MDRFIAVMGTNHDAEDSIKAIPEDKGMDLQEAINDENKQAESALRFIGFEGLDEYTYSSRTHDSCCERGFQA